MHVRQKNGQLLKQFLETMVRFKGKVLNGIDCFWNMMAHAQKPDIVLLRLKCDGTCAETRFRLTAFEMWWHMRRNQISSYCVWNVMAHALKPDFVLLRLKCDCTCPETRFLLSAKRTSPFKSAVASVQLTAGSRGVRISGSNAGYTMFRGSVKGTVYPFHSPVSPSLPLACVTVRHHISTGLYPLFRNVPLSKGGRCVGLTTLPPSCADCLEIWEPQSPGTLRACPGL